MVWSLSKTHLAGPILSAEDERLDSQVHKRLFVQVSDQDQTEALERAFELEQCESTIL